MIPVNPNPPTVAANMAGSRSGPISSTSPVERKRPRHRTWQPSEPSDFMVLAVDVIGHRTTKRHEFRSGRNWKEPAFRHRDAQKWSRLSPASARRMPRSQSAESTRSSRSIRMSGPAIIEARYRHRSAQAHKRSKSIISKQARHFVGEGWLMHMLMCGDHPSPRGHS